MKKTWISALSAAALALPATELFKAAETKDFYNTKLLSRSGEAFTLKKGYVFSVKGIELDPAKKYVISADVRVTPGAGKTNYVFLSLIPSTVKGRRFAAEHVYVAPGSDTVLAGAAKAGDDTLTVRDASGWNNKHPYAYVAFNTKDDYSDLPNFSIERTVKGSVEKEGNVWSVSLINPLKKDYPAGTKIRQHLGGGTYIHAVIRRPSEKWQTVKGVISGARLKAGRSDRQLWPGTGKVRVAVTVSGDEDCSVDFRDLKLEEAQ